MIFPAKIELLQLCDEFLLQCNGAHALPSEGAKPALTGDSPLTAVNLTMKLFHGQCGPPESTIWPDGEREPKSNSQFNKELNDEPYR